MDGSGAFSAFFVQIAERTSPCAPPCVIGSVLAHERVQIKLRLLCEANVLRSVLALDTIFLNFDNNSELCEKCCKILVE